MKTRVTSIFRMILHGFSLSFFLFFSSMPDSFCKTAKLLFPLQLGFLPVNRDAVAAERSWLSTMVHIITCV